MDAIKRVFPSPSADSLITAAAAATDIMLKDKDKTVSMGDEEYRPSAVNTAMFLMSLLQMISIPLGTYPGMPFLPGNVRKYYTARPLVAVIYSLMEREPQFYTSQAVQCRTVRVM